MKKYSVIVCLLMITLSGLSASAQSERVEMNINYSVNTPLGNFKEEAVGKTSYRGFNASILYNFNERFSLGFGTGFNDFYEKFPRRLYKTEDGEVSAVRSISVQVIPLLVKGRYNLISDGAVRPFVGVGVGGNIISYDEYLGIFANTKTSFSFAAQPEAGIYIPFSKSGSTGLTLGANFSYLPFKYGEVKNLNNWGAFVGIKFPLRNNNY